MKDVEKKKKKEGKEVKKEEEKEEAPKKEGKEEQSAEETEEEPTESKSKKTKGEPKDTRPGYMKAFFDMNNNPKFENWFLLAMALFGAYFVATYSPPAKELVYMEFVNDFLTKNRVK